MFIQYEDHAAMKANSEFSWRVSIDGVKNLLLTHSSLGSFRGGRG